MPQREGGKFVRPSVAEIPAGRSGFNMNVVTEGAQMVVNQLGLVAYLTSDEKKIF